MQEEPPEHVAGTPAEMKLAGASNLSATGKQFLQPGASALTKVWYQVTRETLLPLPFEQQ